MHLLSNINVEISKLIQHCKFHKSYQVNSCCLCNSCPYVLYNQKIWLEESLANLVSEQCFAKLKSTKSFVQYLYNSTKFAKLYSCQNPIIANSSKFPPSKLSSYTVYVFYN